MTMLYTIDFVVLGGRNDLIFRVYSQSPYYCNESLWVEIGSDSSRRPSCAWSCSIDTVCRAFLYDENVSKCTRYRMQIAESYAQNFSQVYVKPASAALARGMLPFFIELRENSLRLVSCLFYYFPAVNFPVKGRYEVVP